jgi:hypothetical protein
MSKRRQTSRIDFPICYLYVAFLHLDMNSAAAESAAVEFFSDRFIPGELPR